MWTDCWLGMRRDWRVLLRVWRTSVTRGEYENHADVHDSPEKKTREHVFRRLIHLCIHRENQSVQISPNDEAEKRGPHHRKQLPRGLRERDDDHGYPPTGLLAVHLKIEVVLETRASPGGLQRCTDRIIASDCNRPQGAHDGNCADDKDESTKRGVAKQAKHGGWRLEPEWLRLP